MNNKVPNYSACKEKCWSLFSGLWKSKEPYYSILFFFLCYYLKPTSNSLSYHLRQSCRGYSSWLILLFKDFQFPLAIQCVLIWHHKLFWLGPIPQSRCENSSQFFKQLSKPVPIKDTNNCLSICIEGLYYLESISDGSTF